MANLVFTAAVVSILIGICNGQVYLDSLIQDGGQEPYELVDYYGIRADLCTPGEFFCDAVCSKLLFCQNGTSFVVVETCETNVTFCNAESHACEAGIECIVPIDPPDFKCNAIGYFPDPYNCKIYHLCGNPPAEVLRGTCEGTTAYNPLTTQCSLTDQDRVCLENPIPKCTAPGQIGAQVENPNIYYICLKVGTTLVPSLYKCPGTQVFVGTKCVGTSTTTSTGTTASSVSTSTGTAGTTGTTDSSTSQSTSLTDVTSSTSDGSSTTAASTSTTATPTTTAYPCTAQGTFKDPLDCHSFYFCNANLESIHATCQQGYHYVQGTGCIRGTCTN